MDRFEEPAIRALVTFFARHPGPLNSVLATAVLYIFGYLLFQVKIHRLQWYANAEISFAVISSYLAVERMKASVDLAGLTVVVGAAYLLVRGLENRQKAVEQSAKQNKAFPSLQQQAVSAASSAGGPATPLLE